MDLGDMPRGQLGAQVEPKLTRISTLGAIVLSSGRWGQFLWFIDEGARTRARTPPVKTKF
jgi:hypothetical protein